MTSDQLLEVLGGRDLLVMMCDAKRFSAGVNSVKFWVGPYIVTLSYLPNDFGTCAYRLEIFDVVSGLMVGNAYTTDKDFVRERFEEYTGYSLSF